MWRLRRDEEIIDIMVAFLIFLNLFANTIQSINSKEYTKRKNTSSIYFALISSIFSLIYFLIISKFNFIFDKSTIVYSFFCGIGIIGSVVCCNMATRLGSLALTNLIQTFSLAIPTLFGIFFLKEPMGEFTVVGLILLVICLILTNIKNEKYSVTGKWLFWMSISFFSNGLFATVQKYHQFKTGGQFGNELMIFALSFTVIALLIIVLVFDKKDIKTSLKSTCFPVGHGVMNGIANMSLLLLAPIASASLVYPLLTSSSLIILSLISIIFYKEKLSKRQIIGIILGIISAVLLAI